MSPSSSDSSLAVGCDPLDFSGRFVLVVGGSSGIGNGVARAFLERGAEVHVWGTRASADAYAGEEGSDLSGLTYAQVDVANFAAVEAHAAVKFQPMLAAAGGSMILLSSTAAYHSTRGNPAYTASKAGAVALVRGLGEAWAREGVRVNGVAPGLVDTKLTKVTTDNPERLAGALRGIPAGRLGTPADMTGACLFLASPLASYIIGQTIVVDGGLILS